MESNEIRVQGILKKNNLDLTDVENYILHLNYKNGKILNLGISAITGFIVALNGEINLLALVGGVVLTVVFYFIFGLFLKLGQASFKSNNPIKASNEKESLEHLAKRMCINPNKFDIFIERVKVYKRDK